MEPLLLLARWGSPDTMGMLGRGGAAAGPMSALAEASEVAAMMSDLDDGMINVLISAFSEGPRAMQKEANPEEARGKGLICRARSHIKLIAAPEPSGGGQREGRSPRCVPPQIGRRPTCHAANRPYW